jgi:hypothetical protein
MPYTVTHNTESGASQLQNNPQLCPPGDNTAASQLLAVVTEYLSECIIFQPRVLKCKW